MIHLTALPDLPAAVLSRLATAVRGRRSVQMHELAIVAGISRQAALAFAERVVAAGAGYWSLLVYHRQEDVACAVWSGAESGVLRDHPPLPLLCSVCDDEIEDASELRYDSLLTVTHDFELPA